MSDAVLYRSHRACLVRTATGAVFCISPSGHRYPVSTDSPCVMSIAAVWLELTIAQLATIVDDQPS